MKVARILSFRAKISRHGSVKGRSRYAILVPMELSGKLERESWVGREVMVIIVEPDT